ncbi:MULTISPECIES: FAD-dependent monooxygenase [unclassified Microbacterium]|uniref:FAD-dependent monooxygenase n=1 Tax=unclassified Microbacterium TaxID=2609290 RepID=UPI000EA896C0|nr:MULTISPECIES: FAD-dependent monooxygenase [unclassified Microbacterium]MBT2486530.1 FAD-dependent monooxygenase [Microbacterium sp. ISL-108]RKN69223.1 3-hydroxybenzoate 4-monooxygenase [Microbacterium sp. CGR2]
MQIHHRGYEADDPRIRPAAGYGRSRAQELPERMDVLVVGTGPAGAIVAAQLSRFPSIDVRVIEKRRGRLTVGQADGIQARSVETFQAFGFATEVIDEAYRNVEMCFWKPDPANPRRIVRTSRVPDDAVGISEFPHIYVNQSRILDYFLRDAVRAPGKVVPDYGVEFVGCDIDPAAEYPVTARIRYVGGSREGRERIIRAKYLVGADGARSTVRTTLGHRLHGEAAMHAWGVMDVLVNTDFPDIQVKCSIQSHDAGNILLIPREGEYLVRMYVDLGITGNADPHQPRDTSAEQLIAIANRILHPYTLDVRAVTWWSVYEVAHRITDGFDDVPASAPRSRPPHAFIMGDACHTHSAKAGQGMNVSIQDGFNLGWKMAAVLEGRAPQELLSTYAEERKGVAQDLIDFDRGWSEMMARPVDSWDDPTELERYYVSTMEFPAGFMTQYAPSLITLDDRHQHLAKGFPVGKRFKSAEVIRRADNRWRHLGHAHEADGRWRVYVFADAAAPSRTATPTADFAAWWQGDPSSPRVRYTPADGDTDAVFDTKVIYQQDYTQVEPGDVPDAFRPVKVPLGLTDINQVFAAGHERDIHREREISDEGAIVLVRPDQYVAGVLPLTARAELTDFFARNMREPPPAAHLPDALVTIAERTSL